ncbi:dihydrolipoamide dehydrogenase [Staphylococcus piscifermentans]|uniref:Dihydrolipoamide dehydrogenase n=1 Tax=Staphylococcus piscifermentans TaxID=70258 RepID=A0A239TFU2_9STAP|nr:NAD(P)/FAD-dependent oxidoreductase [Staphylococcus piscifermentans]RTX86531.1 NAD(P)/FAD-dependent oxidoreductase [Staphylococcus piscifermentans]GEP85100.1 dihydrolipoamide dehydrogenase [Staphylococcus piscifermentans]SNU95744.1 dihydrolipoamide dehydrogenase [Staphylococcus piscifermentans]
MKRYDVVFIGSGHAAWHAAVTLANSGKSVAIIEKDKVAGTCTNFGCNAKILLEGPYEVLEEASHYDGIIEADQLQVNWEHLMKYKKEIINPMSDFVASMIEQQGIDLYMGKGVIKDAHTVTVDDTELEAENIVIGTGQHSHQLEIDGKEYTHDSRDFLSMDQLPERMVMIGAGIISMEFASIMIKSGVKVDIIHHSDEALKGFNRSHVQKLVEKLKAEGVQFHFNENTTAVIPSKEGYLVETESGLSIETDYVLDATGRKPNVQNIGLENAGIQFSNRGIQVDDYMRTNVSNIFASGDVVDKMIPKLTPTATFESNYIASQILGVNPEPIHYPAIPEVVYALPRLSQIGVSVEEAENDDAYTVKYVPFGKQMVFEYKNEVEAEMYIVLDQDKHLVGAAVYGDDAPDLINILTFIVDGRMTAQELNQHIFAFPGASSGVIDMLKMNML